MTEKELLTTATVIIDGKETDIEVYITPCDLEDSFNGFNLRGPIVLEKYTLTKPVDHHSNIYLVRNDETNRYKIGYSTTPITLKTILDCEITLIASCLGGADRELMLHTKYAKNRYKGKWFEFSMIELEEVIREFSKYRDIPQKVPSKHQVSELQ